jgi:hypothetical protein
VTKQDLCAFQSLIFIKTKSPTRVTYSSPNVGSAPHLGGAGIVAPRGTPQETVRRLSSEIGAILAHPEVRERFRTLGFQPIASTPAEMAGLVRKDLRRYAELV